MTPQYNDVLPPDLFPSEEEPSSDSSNMGDHSLGEKRSEETDETPIMTKPQPKPEAPLPPVHPINGFDVESDEGGEEPSELEGGLMGRRKIHLRKPRIGATGNDREPSSDKHSRKSTEERAVDLFRIYILDPEGISIRDQRLRAGVGADLVRDDNIFRELKARSGSIGDKVELTSYEYARAGQVGTIYELVIVEHVWGDPVITIIRNRLGRLKHYPIGAIVVEGWKGLDPQPRVIQLRKIDAID
jgi:hypothetical protein